LDDISAARRANHSTEGLKEGAKPKLFQKGQSKRIWTELYKVLDSSDVVVQVLDVRDPLGTRSRRIEDELKKPDRRHKHLVFLLNKCDLVPTWVTRRWVKVLSAEYPTLAFHASITNPFGKGSLIALLRQFAQIHKERKQISVGFVGYPNVGKSSVINTLRGKKVCEAAPIPGRTRVWRYITLFKRIFLIDCPGTVYSASISDVDCVLKGVVRIDKLPEPEEFIQAVLDRVKKEYLVRTYAIGDWKDSNDFLEQLAFKSGKLLRVCYILYLTMTCLVLTFLLLIVIK
jgi:nuclear GTP-binding protein